MRPVYTAGNNTECILSGILAWKQLLKGSVPLTSFSKRYRLYEKSGSYDDALKDFYAVYPKHVRIEQDKPVHRVNQVQVC